MFSPRSSLGLEAQKAGLGLGLVITGLGLGLGLVTVVASASYSFGLVVFEMLLKCFVTLTLKTWYFLFNV